MLMDQAVNMTSFDPKPEVCEQRCDSDRDYDQISHLSPVVSGIPANRRGITVPVY